MAVGTELDQEYDREELDDLRHAIALIAGYQEWPDGPNGLPNKQYLSGDKELVARKALVRLLRNPKPLDFPLRRLLAALFDPETEQPPYASFEAAPLEQRVELKFRHRGGGRLQSMRKLELGIAFENLCQEPGKSRDDALNEIAEKYSVEPRTVETAAKHLRTVLDQ